jgi:hypothetical protein
LQGLDTRLDTIEGQQAARLANSCACLHRSS